MQDVNEYISLANSFFNDFSMSLGSLFTYEGLQEISSNLWKNPLAVILLLAVVVKFFTSGKVNDIEGSLVRSINSIEDWNKALDESKNDEKYLVVDCFATWCPPCRVAAPLFGLMSIEYKDSNAIFCKVDVDKVSAVARSLNVTSMPSFKIIKNAIEVNGMLGWNETALKEMLAKSGCSFVKIDKVTTGKKE